MQKMYQSSYHNTTSTPPKKAKARAVKCGEQEMYILKIYQSQKIKTGYTAWEVIEITLSRVWHKIEVLPDLDRIIYGIGLSTSVKRSITNLCNAGKLIATDERREGKLGKENKVYKIP